MQARNTHLVAGWRFSACSHSHPTHSQRTPSKSTSLHGAQPCLSYTFQPLSGPSFPIPALRHRGPDLLGDLRPWAAPLDTWHQPHSHRHCGPPSPLRCDPASLPSAQAFLLGPHDWVSFLPAQGGGSDDTELRYSSQYEERLDPFSSFSKRVCGLASGQGRLENPPPPLASALPYSPLHQTTRAPCTPTLVPWRPRVHPGWAHSTQNTCLMAL